MKRKLILGVVASLALVISSRVMANGTPPPPPAPEGVEISGNVDVVYGFQHDSSNVPAAVLGTAQGGMGDILPVANSGTGGVAASADHSRFVVDQAEVDLQKKFGENIRLRADLDFGDFGNTGSRNAAGDFFDLEQAYVTANIAWGNGLEFLIGKYNAPVGVNSVDRNENWFVSYPSAYRFFTPTNVTGIKFYYAFSDLIDLHFGIVNDLNANGFAFDSTYPSALFRLGFNWGGNGKKNTVGISGGIGPEQSNALAASFNSGWDFYGDVDLMIALSDDVTIAWEGVYRQSGTRPAGTTTQKGIASFLALQYQASDVWDVDFRGDFAWDINAVTAGSSGASTTGGNFIGYQGTLFGGSVGAGYKIADGAKMKMEYRFDLANTKVAGVANPTFHSVLAEFAYTF